MQFNGGGPDFTSFTAWGGKVAFRIVTSWLQIGHKLVTIDQISQTSHKNISA